MTGPWGTTQTGQRPQVPQSLSAVARTVGADLWAEIPAQNYEYGITDVVITGPLCDRFDVYMNAVGDQNIGSTTRTDSNSAAYPTPQRIPTGTRIIGVWLNGAGLGIDGKLSINTVSY